MRTTIALIALALASPAFADTAAQIAQACKDDQGCIVAETEAINALQTKVTKDGKPEASKLQGCMFAYVAANGPDDKSKLYRFLSGCL